MSVEVDGVVGEAPWVSEGQKGCVYAASYCSACAKRVVSNVEGLFRPMEGGWGAIATRVGKVVESLFLAPWALGLGILSLGFSVAAAVMGPGRFEQIGQSSAWEGRSVRVLALNTCFQHPWSPLTGGVEAPMVRVAGQVHRAAAVARGIADKNVDICLLQECEDLATQDFLVESLRDSGYSTFVRDLGAHDPVRNVSGLFIASKVPLEGVRWLPFIDKTGLGKWSNQGALAVDIRLGDRSVRLINAHLNYGGEEAQEVRNRQFAQIQAMMHEGAVLFADLNFDTSRHPLEGGYINALEGRVTCSDEPKHALRGKPYEGCDGCEEKIDGIVYGPQARVRVTVEELGPLKAGEKALSDHFASVATVAAQ